MVFTSVIMVFVFFMGFSAFQFILNESAQFENELVEMKKTDYERKQEDLTVLGNPFCKENHLNLTIVNVGEVDSSISWIILLNPIDNNPIYGYFKIDPPLLLRPDEISSPQKCDETWIFPGGYEGTTSYIIQMITERGTKIDYIYPNPGRMNIKMGTELITIGPFIFEFTGSSFTYTSNFHSSRQTAWEIQDYEDNIMFYIILKNNCDKSVEMNGFSYLSLVIPSQPLSNFIEVEVPFYLVDEESTKESLIAYDPSNPVVIGPGEYVVFKFAASVPLGASFNRDNCLSAQNDPGTENLVTTFLVLFWEYSESGETLGLTIPFVSIYIPQY
jgi:hypothetical protein